MRALPDGPLCKLLVRGTDVATLKAKFTKQKLQLEFVRLCAQSTSQCGRADSVVFQDMRMGCLKT
jgi:hypothetical protein